MSFRDKVSDFLEDYCEPYYLARADERAEKAKKDKEMCDKLRKEALNPKTVYKDENGNKLSLLGSIPKRMRILKATKKEYFIKP